MAKAIITPMGETLKPAGRRRPGDVPLTGTIPTARPATLPAFSTKKRNVLGLIAASRTGGRSRKPAAPTAALCFQSLIEALS